MSMKQTSAEVFHETAIPACIGPVQFSVLRADVDCVKNKRTRICTHKNAADPLHEMFILLRDDSPLRAHKHLVNDETVLILEGRANCQIYDRAGRPSKIIPLSDYASGEQFHVRIPAGTWHRLIPKTRYVAVHEVTCGPFIAENTVIAPWEKP